jgi:hypothetical protein
VGIFFVTQTPKDVPDDVLAQLGSRVQHQLRAHTPNDAKALKATVATYPTSAYDLTEVLQSLGIGEAIVTVLNPNGAPTPVAWTRMRAPEASMDPMPEQMMAGGIAQSAMMRKYGQAVNRDSAYEMLTRKLEAGAAAAAEEQQRAEQAKADAAAAKERDKQAAAQARSQGRTTSRPAPKSGFEKVLSSPTFWNKVITVGGEITRGMFGTARKR